MSLDAGGDPLPAGARSGPSWRTKARAPHGWAHFEAPSTLGLATLALLVVLWISTHPFTGIVHDARLYTLQTLSALQPGRFAQDLYLKYGSQDAFTLFTPLYKPLVAAVGPGLANMLATIAGQIAWFAALVFLMRAVFADGRTSILAVLAVVALDRRYGGLGVLRYAETFATPRLFAEALVLAALAFALRGRLVAAALCVFAAGALHPIMTAGGLAVMAVLAALKDRRVWLLIGLGVAAGLLLAALGLEPFARLFLSFDDAWFQIIRQRCGFCFLTRWSWMDWTQLAATGAILLSAYSLAAASERRLILALAIASAAGLIATYVGGEVARDVLLVNIQPWRVLWLTTLFANAWIAAIVLRLPRAWISRQLFIVAMLLSGFSSVFGVVPIAPYSVALAAGLALAWERRQGSPLPFAPRVLLRVLAGVALVVAAAVAWKLAAQPTFGGSLLRAALAATALIFLFWRPEAPASVARTTFSAALVCVSAMIFDQRDGWRKFIETPGAPTSLQSFSARSGNVYWENGLEWLWFKLRRPSYYSCAQSAGVMFYRGTAMEYERRVALLAQLNTRDFSNAAGSLCPSQGSAAQQGPQTRQQLERTCRALPDLDTIVLVRQVQGAAARLWVAPVKQVYTDKAGRTFEDDRFYAYACSQLR